MFYKNILFYGFWLFLTILLAYWFSYPLDAFSRHNFFGGKDQTPISRRVQKDQGKALSVRLIRSAPSWLVESFKAFSRCHRALIELPLVCVSKFPKL